MSAARALSITPSLPTTAWPPGSTARAAPSQDRLRRWPAGAAAAAGCGGAGAQGVRQRQGALGLATLEAAGGVRGQCAGRSEARRGQPRQGLIRYFMIAANGVVARYLEAHTVRPRCGACCGSRSAGRASMQSRGHSGRHCPHCRMLGALADFSSSDERPAAAAVPDLSLAVVKLLGAGSTC